MQRQQARKKRGSIRYKRLGRQVAKLHERIGNLRREFLHQTTSRMVAVCAVLATEELRTQNMSRSAKGTQNKPGRMVKQKAGLNREILSAGLSMAHNMLAYKVVEAGSRLHVSNTRQLKPSQRCAACWEIVPKTLAQRVQECPHCGRTAQRDQNAASVVLIDAHTPGTGVAARPKPLARTHQVKVCDPRNPRYRVARRLAVGEFINDSSIAVVSGCVELRFEDDPAGDLAGLEIVE